MNKILVDKPKAAFSLYRKKGSKYTSTLTKSGAQIWACGECGILYTPYNNGDNVKQRALECCLQKYCECGKKIEPYRIGPKCGDCNNFDRRISILNKAEEIESTDNPVYCEDNDRYWSDLEDFLDWAKCEIENGEELPEYIFPCETEKFARLDVQSILESALDQHHEDAIEQIEDYNGLQKFLNEWSDKQSISSWHPVLNKKINVKKLMDKK